MQSIWIWCRESATIVVARVYVAFGLLWGSIGELTDLLGAPEVHQAMQGVIPPKFWPFYAVGMAMSIEKARRRTLGDK